LTNPTGAGQKAGNASSEFLKVLVIDDERDLADITGALLDAHGISNVVAYSPGEGLKVLASELQINALFSDIMMPEMTGLQLALKVREAYPAVKIVLTSGFTPPGLLSGHGGLYQYIKKPYDILAVIRLLSGSAG
jgi:CheY-like chemotaxis protein